MIKYPYLGYEIKVIVKNGRYEWTVYGQAKKGYFLVMGSEKQKSEAIAKAEEYAREQENNLHTA